MADFDREADVHSDFMIQAFGQADVCACDRCRAGDVVPDDGEAAAEALAADVVRILAEVYAPAMTAEQLDLVPFGRHDAESDDAPRPDRPAPVHAVLQAGRAC